MMFDKLKKILGIKSNPKAEEYFSHPPQDAENKVYAAAAEEKGRQPIEFEPNNYYSNLLEMEPVALKQGDVIAAKPYFSEGPFQEKLILITSVSEDAIQGLIINGNEDIETDIIWGNKKLLASIGGPVMQDVMIGLIFSDDNKIKAVTITKDEIVNYLENNNPNPRNVKILMGCAGWRLPQFDDEYNCTVWHICKDYYYSLHDALELNLWQKIMNAHYKNKYKKILPKLKAIYNNGNASTEGATSVMMKGLNKDGKVEDFEIPASALPIQYPIASDLSIFFVEDIGNAYTFVTGAFLDGNKSLNLKRLVNQSIRTFVKDVLALIKLSKAEQGFYFVEADGELESNVILIDEFMNFAHSNIGDELMIGLPATNILLIADANDTFQVEAMKAYITAFSKDENTPGKLSNSIYRRKLGDGNLIKVWNC